MVISFPNQFDEDYREGIEDDYYFLAEKSFQMTNGKNPMMSHIKSFREISSYMLSLIEVACTSPFCVTVSWQKSILRVSVDLTLLIIGKGLFFAYESY